MMESDGRSGSAGDLQGSIMGAFVASAEPAPVLTIDLPKTDPDVVGVSGSGPVQADATPVVANRNGFGRRTLEWALVLLGALVLAVLIRQFMVQAFWIESESMESTLEVRDRVLVNRLSYTFGDVSRGDVIVFARLPDDPGQTRDLIKRVIGLPGDTVEGRDNTIYINGSRLTEPYVDPESNFFADFGPVSVPDHEVFVMGDNRDQSLDSRRFGTIDIDRAAGRAFITFWPMDRIGSL
jgi:signal peptidase I